ncbi:MAG: UDP-N-acetylglucosamine diphosphorylase/glucosamine-1-phosphate N-acetyltransferase [Acidobacteria bacterium]|nr:MAG: UDP-N-acetylglucosamine diphosphorylase/glucosamine-1-phosphate N-acetyltransferase [Acidobacteriota bacterium]
MNSNDEAEKPLNVLILAAGLGTRMKSDLAKVLHRLDGRPLIEHVFRTALSLNPKKVFIVVGHQADDVRAALPGSTHDARIEFVVQKEQLGTGDAVNAARDRLADVDSNILVLSGDVPLIKIETLRELIAVHLLENAACTVLTVKLSDPFGYGRVIRGDGGLDRIVEQKDATDAERKVAEINSGIYCFDSGKLFDALSNVKTNNAQGEYYLTDVPRLLLDNDETVALFLHDQTFEVEGVNDRKQLASIEKMINEETIEKLMKESGVTFIDPRNAYISSTAAIGRDTVIYPNVTIEGNTVVGINCVIRSGTRLSNAMIGDGVEIRDNCLIIDSDVGDRCSVGPMAHLRGHAVMVEGAKVGNFVEMKKTRLGKNSKAAHLTYLGDATVGEDANIGAGVVTCNYDGKNKHETHIGDRVKIGSDTMLVAPVTVGDGATTGAGSVVTKDVEPGETVVGVPAKTLRALAKKD